jgi:transcriptional antiterminator RfaH
MGYEYSWYLVHSKPRKEQVALENLERQGYECYLPKRPMEKKRRGKVEIADEPLFSRYLFIHLAMDFKSQSWAPIRSTLGVSTMVHFGDAPVAVADKVIAALKAAEAEFSLGDPERLFHAGEAVRITEGPFAGIEGVYQMDDSEQRALVLIEMLGKSVVAKVEKGSLGRGS